MPVEECGSWLLCTTIKPDARCATPSCRRWPTGGTGLDALRGDASAVSPMCPNRNGQREFQVHGAKGALNFYGERGQSLRRLKWIDAVGRKWGRTKLCQERNPESCEQPLEFGAESCFLNMHAVEVHKMGAGGQSESTGADNSYSSNMANDSHSSHQREDT